MMWGRWLGMGEGWWAQGGVRRDQRQLELPVNDNYFCRLQSY